MDSSSLETIITTGNINTELTTRYGGTCTFNTPLTNVWTNYYAPRATSLGGPNGAATAGTVLKRATDANAQVISSSSPGVIASLNTIDGLFTTFQTTLSAINPLVNPTTGLVAGLNCVLFG